MRVQQWQNVFYKENNLDIGYFQGNSLSNRTLTIRQKFIQIIIKSRPAASFKQKVAYTRLGNSARQNCFNKNIYSLGLLLHAFKSFALFCRTKHRSLFRRYFGVSLRYSLRKIRNNFPVPRTVPRLMLYMQLSVIHYAKVFF